MHYRPPSLCSRYQKGSVLIQFALLALVLLTILGVVQIGYMYSIKRDLQRIADLVALESTDALRKGANTCSYANTAGVQSIEKQWPFGEWPFGVKPKFYFTEMIECGNWNAQDGFRKGFGPNDAFNAVRVTLTGITDKLIPFFTGNTEVMATATAARPLDAIAAFSVGAQLICGTLLHNVTGVDLCALNSDGVLNEKTTPAGLLHALGVDLDLKALTPEDVIKIPQFTVKQIISASASVVGEQSADVSTTIFGQLKTDVDIKPIQLISTTESLGLFTMTAIGSNGNYGSAADVQVAIKDIIGTALVIGSKAHAIDAGISLPGKLISAKLQVVSPPSYASGPAKPFITQAYNSQVRLNLKTEGLGSVLGMPLLPLNISVDLVNGKGILEKISCKKEPKTVDIDVQSSIGKVCIGNLNSFGNECSPMDILLGLVKIKAETDLFPSDIKTIENITIEKPEYSQINSLPIGSTLASLLDTNNLKLELIGISLGPVISLIRPILVTGLTPILNSLGAYLSSTLLEQLLGMKLGQTAINVSDIQCDSAQLVN